MIQRLREYLTWLRFLKLIFGLVWLGVLITFIRYGIGVAAEIARTEGLGGLGLVRETLVEIVKSAQSRISSMGVAGPLSFLLLYLIRPLVFMPGTVLTTTAGALFGPFLGFTLSMIGENVSANISFWIARIYGGSRDLMQKSKLTAKLDECLCNDGFFYMLLLRFLWLPFDLVNYSAGLSKIKWKDYFWGTLLGVIPGMFTFIFLGNSLDDGPKSLMISIVFLVVTTLLGYVMHRSKRGQNFS